MSTWDALYNEVLAYWYGLVTLVYGRQRIAKYDQCPEWVKPHDWRSRLAGWMLLRRNF